MTWLRGRRLVWVNSKEVFTTWFLWCQISLPFSNHLATMLMSQLTSGTTV
ncbi:unnamed protein product [Prunus brigantina]